MADAFLVWNFIMSIVNISLHAMGISLLLSLKGDTYSVNRMLIFNLSLSELLQAVVECLHNICNFSGVQKEILHNIRILQLTTLSGVYYTIMFCITLDKLVQIVLDIKYPIIITEFRVRVAMWILWILVWLSCIPFLAFHIIQDWEPLMVIFIIYMVFDIVYLILAVCTYSFLFNKFLRSRVAPVTLQASSAKPDPHQIRTIEVSPIEDKENNNNKSREEKNGCFHVFRRSTFFVSTLVICSFIVFMIVPDFIYFGTVVMIGQGTYDLREYVVGLYEFSWLFDGLIYILFDRDVKRALMARIARICNKDGRATSRSIPSSTLESLASKPWTTGNTI